MVSFVAYGAPAESAPLVRLAIDRREPGPHDVVVEIAYCGVCHSDIHTVRGEWGPLSYPVVPGHEIAGHVAAVGSSVTRFGIGDRVGVGCMVDSCRRCEECRRGEEQYCAEVVATYAATDRDGTPTQGGYASHIVVSEDFVLRIPDSLPLEIAAPLMCAGITTYSALRRHGTGPGTRVAVVGLGGLGHLAVQIAHGLGAQVTVLSQSLRKRAHSLRLGAVDHRALADPRTPRELDRSQDLVLNTVSADLDVDGLLGLLRPRGVLACVGVPQEPMSVTALSLEDRGLTVSGSSIGGIRETQEMLEFCGRQQIGAEVELIRPDLINEGYQRVLASDVFFRLVIDLRAL